MVVRTLPERVIQTLAFETGGVIVVTPLWMVATGEAAVEGALLVATLAVAVMIWSPLHNTLFDVVEWRLARRVASDRPPRWRIVHALSHEVTSLAVTLPLILWLTDLGLGAAILADLGLTAVYTAYAFVFHVVYDRVRPVSQGGA
jgi:uncharacterized membrane protein